MVLRSCSTKKKNKKERPYAYNRKKTSAVFKDVFDVAEFQAICDLFQQQTSIFIVVIHVLLNEISFVWL